VDFLAKGLETKSIPADPEKNMSGSLAKTLPETYRLWRILVFKPLATFHPGRMLGFAVNFGLCQSLRQQLETNGPFDGPQIDNTTFL
jgi:hypothetical protein